MTARAVLAAALAACALIQIADAGVTYSYVQPTPSPYDPPTYAAPDADSAAKPVYYSHSSCSTAPVAQPSLPPVPSRSPTPSPEATVAVPVTPRKVIYVHKFYFEGERCEGDRDHYVERKVCARGTRCAYTGYTYGKICIKSEYCGYEAPVGYFVLPRYQTIAVSYSKAEAVAAASAFAAATASSSASAFVVGGGAASASASSAASAGASAPGTGGAAAAANASSSANAAVSSGRDGGSSASAQSSSAAQAAAGGAFTFPSTRTPPVHNGTVAPTAPSTTTRP